MTTLLIWLGVILGSVALLYVLLLLVVAFVSVRPPRIPTFLSPVVLGDPEETVEFSTSDNVRLRGWWVPGEGKTVVVAFHGFLANRCEWVPYSPRLRALGLSLLFVDHRCHGGSERRKCTFGIDEVSDVVAAVDFARKRAPGCRIVLLGSSMGGTAVCRAAAAHPGLADAIILDGPYANLAEAAKGFWYVTGFKSVAKLLAPAGSFGRLWLGFDPKRIDMESEYKKLSDIPVLFLYGTEGTVVPKASAQRCVDGANGTVEWFEGSGHAQGRFAEPNRYFKVMVDFLKEKGFINSPNETASPSTFFEPDPV